MGSEMCIRDRASAAAAAAADFVAAAAVAVAVVDGIEGRTAGKQD